MEKGKDNAIILGIVITIIILTLIIFLIYKTNNKKTFFKSVSEKSWFFSLIITTITASLLYLILHWVNIHVLKSSKIQIDYLNKEQIITINTILESPIDSDSLKAKGDSIRLRDVLAKYLFSTYPNIDATDKLEIESIIKNASFVQLKSLLPVRPLKEKSFFYLNKDWIYLEIIFWSIFGVLCNLLYSTSEAIRKNVFDKRELYVQVAKLVYTPFCVVIIYICYNEIQSTGQQYEIKYSLYSIAVAFLLGFFSGRMIELLNKVKDVFLPLGKDATESELNAAEKVDEQLPEATPEIIKEAIKEKGEEWVNSFPNVTGFAARNKISEGKDTGRSALVFIVSEKKDSVEFGHIPIYLEYEYKADGKKYKILTDVEEMEETIEQLTLIKNSPYQLGCSISRADHKSSGTAGLVLKKYNDSPDKNYLLSCYHVFCAPELDNNNRSFSIANSSGELNVVCPSYFDGAADVIGKTVAGELKNDADFGIVEIIKGIEFANTIFGTDIKPSGFISIIPTDKGKIVRFCGRTSGLVSGKIKSHYSSQTITYNKPKNIKQYLTGLIEIEPVSKAGDSGAVAVDEQNKVIGLIVSGNSTSSYIIPVNDFISNNNFYLT